MLDRGPVFGSAGLQSCATNRSRRCGTARWASWWQPAARRRRRRGAGRRPDDQRRGRSDPVLVADERQRGAGRRAVHRRAHLRGRRERDDDGRARSIAARAGGDAAAAVRGDRRIARSRSAQRFAPVLPVPVQPAADQRRDVRQGRAHPERADQLQRREPRRARRGGSRPRSHLHPAVGIGPGAVARARRRDRHPRRAVLDLRRHRGAAFPRARVLRRRAASCSPPRRS